MHNTSSDSSELIHVPVLLTETIEFLNLKEGMSVVDCTLGLGGHSSEIMKAIGPSGHLYAFDKDERNIEIAEKRLLSQGEYYTVFYDSFSSLKDRLRGEGVSHVDAILFDLGLSSPHIDDAERGFSFQKNGPLNMRFDNNPLNDMPAAADLLHLSSEEELADIFFHYGEIKSARKLARAIVEQRREVAFKTTTQFADFVREVVGGKVLPLAFQALRIAVNEELTALELGLGQALELLAPHGRVVVLSYHSLEDRFVKHFFKQHSVDSRDPNDPFGRRVLRSKSLSLPIRKPITPSAEEIKNNPRARSAKLRVAEKLS